MRVYQTVESVDLVDPDLLVRQDSYNLPTICPSNFFFFYNVNTALDGFAIFDRI